ncbi:MAG: hypothetical protein IJN67_14730 [Oscillospiraceae bacterium]|nr:hypothetical protein [Oscillospiraceae bacterium]
MKKITQFLCLVLAFSMIATVPAYAAGPAPRASDYFASYSSHIEVRSVSSFRVWYQVGAVKGMDELGVSEIYIQRSSDGVNWTTVKTYSSDDYTSMICENTGSHDGYVTYANASSGYYYRARVDYYAKLGNGYATYMDYTSSIHT